MRVEKNMESKRVRVRSSLGKPSCVNGLALMKKTVIRTRTV